MDSLFYNIIPWTLNKSINIHPSEWRCSLSLCLMDMILKKSLIHQFNVYMVVMAAATAENLQYWCTAVLVSHLEISPKKREKKKKTIIKNLSGCFTVCLKYLFCCLEAIPFHQLYPDIHEPCWILFSTFHLVLEGIKLGVGIDLGVTLSCMHEPFRKGWLSLKSEVIQRPFPCMYGAWVSMHFPAGCLT